MTPRQHRVEGLESLRPRHRKRIASRSDYQRKRGKQEPKRVVRLATEIQTLRSKNS